MQTKDHWMLAHHMLDRFPEFMDANRRTIQLNVDQKKKQIDHPHYAGKRIVAINKSPRGLHRIAYLLGNVGPDFNPFTYLKRRRYEKPLAGHNYPNVEPYIQRETSRLQRIRHWNALDYFRAGRVIHYVADSFTFPHNMGFRGGNKEHVDYEKQLHEVFPEYLEKFKAGLAQKEQHGLDVLHQGYERVCKKHVKAAVDSQFILQAVHDAHLRLFHGR